MKGFFGDFVSFCWLLLSLNVEGHSDLENCCLCVATSLEITWPFLLIIYRHKLPVLRPSLDSSPSGLPCKINSTHKKEKVPSAPAFGNFETWALSVNEKRHIFIPGMIAAW